MSEVILIRDSSDEESSSKQTNEYVKEKSPVDKPENGLESANTSSGISSARKMTDERLNSTETKTNDIFEEFIDCCLSIEKSKGSKPYSEFKDIMKFLKTTHQNSTFKFKSSRRFRKILQKYIETLKNGSQDVYVYISDVISELEGHGTRKNERSTPEKAVKHKTDFICPEQCSKKPKINMKLEEAVSSESREDKLLNDSNSVLPEFNPDTPSSSATACDHANKLSAPAEDTARRIKYLEKLLHKLSKEIIRLQNQELTLEELDREDSTYIQECKLKDKAMKVYKQLCTLNKSPIVTGRVTEKRIGVRSSRFDEINKKVERFINNPKKNFIKQFPNFRDIFFTVKQANNKHQLNLPPPQLKNIAQNIFEEVGEKLQKRRKVDFLYEFGNIPEDVKVDDPAESNEELDSRLKENGKIARTNLDSVIEKYTKLQHNDNSHEPQLESERKNNEDDDDDDEDDDNMNSSVSENDDEEDDEEEEFHEENEVILIEDDNL